MGLKKSFLQLLIFPLFSFFLWFFWLLVDLFYYPLRLPERVNFCSGFFESRRQLRYLAILLLYQS